LFNDGASLLALANAYADVLLEKRAEGFEFDLLFGPAYKGITLASATAMALAQKGLNTPYAYNRKEAKDHGEGGVLVGADMAGKRVVIIDDVISAGTSVRESVRMIQAAGATPAAVLIALDRMEKSGTAEDVGQYSAVQSVQQEFDLPVFAIATLADLMAFLHESDNQQLVQHKANVAQYREKYGI
jgi:orotate phosphoribosyltransferase